MNWLAFALLSPTLLTVVNYFDKFIVVDQVREPKAMPIYISFVAAFYGTVFWLLAGMPVLSVETTLLTLARGSLTVVAAVLYFHALHGEQASSVVILMQTTPVLVLALSFIFLHETISAVQFIGFALILSAAIGVSLARTGGGFRLSPAFWMMLLTNFVTAVSFVLGKFILDNNPLFDILGYESWGLALGGTVLFFAAPTIRRAFLKNVAVVPRRALGAVFMSESIFTFAKLFSFTALALGGPVALVSVLTGTQVFIAILLGWGLTLIAPAIYAEEIGRVGLLKKGAFAALMFAGVSLVG